MAALPLPADADAVMVDAGADEVGTPSVEKTEGSGVAAKGQVQQTPAQGQQQAGGGGGGGGKGKKKRGKK